MIPSTWAAHDVLRRLQSGATQRNGRRFASTCGRFVLAGLLIIYCVASTGMALASGKGF